MDRKNPATDSHIYNPSAKQMNERKVLSTEAIKVIIPSLCCLERMDQLYLSLVIFIGMKRGEVLGLRWKDVDLVGQSDFKTTMNRYVHPRDNRKREAIKNVSLLLQGED